MEDYAKLLHNCAVLVGNSSSGIREASFLGVPVVNIGTRQNFRERGVNVIQVGYNRQEIREAVLYQIKNGKYPSSNLYGDGTSAIKMHQVLKHAEIDPQKRFYDR
jgi:UDP-N-acetylglucosamine 2-epimerase